MSRTSRVSHYTPDIKKTVACPYCHYSIGCRVSIKPGKRVNCKNGHTLLFNRIGELIREFHQTGCICADCSGAELTADND